MVYCESIPYRQDTASYYKALADLPWAIWLDSGGMARYDIMTAVPHRTMVLKACEVSGDVFALLRTAMGDPVPSIQGVPFAGGILGYWSYDLARHQLDLPSGSIDTQAVPDLAVGIYDWALVLDHQRRTAQLVSHQRHPDTWDLLAKILRRIHREASVHSDTFSVLGDISFNFTPESYAVAFGKVQQYLRAGDCYQINLAQRFSARAEGNALTAYLTLREWSPAPYSAFLNLPDLQILSVSPECFLRVNQGQVETKPIKGTRPRSSDAQLDQQLAESLRNHPKDKAENVMIVDLLRSDLSRHCRPGSVQTLKLFDIESFANVHHLVSTITGHLKVGRDAFDVLRDSFPGGSITGAPKRRAMQIIEQLEPNRRGVYCGAIGYIGFDGNMDTSIAIRTLVYTGNQIQGWAGGGIVADSEEAAEYQETFDKASLMMAVLQKFGGRAPVKN